MLTGRKRLFYVITAGLAALCGILLLYFCYPAWHKFFPCCPTYKYLHVYCSGCGATRALYCLLHGDFCKSLANNFFMIPTLAIVGLLLLFPKLRQHTKLINAYVIIVILYGILRNVPCHPFTLMVPVGI